jgi:hypothetical protein
MMRTLRRIKEGGGPAMPEAHARGALANRRGRPRKMKTSTVGRRASSKVKVGVLALEPGKQPSARVKPGRKRKAPDEAALVKGRGRKKAM